MHAAYESVWFRLTIVLALVWAVPAVTVTLSMGLETLNVGPQIHHDVMFLGTSQVVGAAFLLWWRFVHWAFRRVAGTAATTAALFGHLVLWKPLWTTGGCVPDDPFLLFGQSHVMGGMWILLTAYVWWGLAEGVNHWRKRAMPSCAVRLIYGLAMVPVIPGLWVIVILAFRRYVWTNEIGGFAFTNAVCALAIALWWWLAWRKAVQWNGPLIRQTLLLGTAFVVACGLASGFRRLADWDWVGSLTITGPLFLVGVWYVATVLLWRVHPRAPRAAVEEARELLKCSSCGYSLIGLYESRCPECGRTRTLDELFGEMLVARGDI
jgi:hypothetical protein